MSECQANAEDFKLEKGYEPLAHKTLEDILSEGESPEEKEDPSERITVNSYPQWLRSIGIYLKHKHTNAANVSAIERLTIKIGIAIARQEYNPLAQQIQNLKKIIFESGDQIYLMKAYNTGYRLQETVSTVYHKCSVRGWQMGAITELLVEPVGLSSSTAVLLTLICGISTSTKWVPPRWVALAKREMESFRQYLEGEITRLERIKKSV